MGYSTKFFGEVSIEPPLNDAQCRFLHEFSKTRHEREDEETPGIWCQWIPNEDGTALVWDGREKFYNSAEWMEYILETFLQHHICNGRIECVGESTGDLWCIDVDNNTVVVLRGRVTY